MVRRGVDDRKLRIRTPYVCMLCNQWVVSNYALHTTLSTHYTTLVERRTTHEALGHVLVEC